jgi:hypothetical protein
MVIIGHFHSPLMNQVTIGNIGILCFDICLQRIILAPIKVADSLF